MTELEKIAYAKSFIDKLANGINPLDGTAIPDDQIVNNVRLARCFFYVSDVLRQVIDNGGVCPPPQPKEDKEKKQPYYLTPEQAEQFAYSSIPISASEIFNRICAIGPQEGVKKFPRTHLTKWLISIGLMEETVLPTGAKGKRPTPEGEEIGMSLEERQGQYGLYYVTLYNRDAQHFILDNIDAVLNFGNDPTSREDVLENQGRPWTDEHERLLAEMFQGGASVSEMATALKRNSGGIRARLKRMGLIENRSDI
jgi:hypothetical protein